MKQNKVCTNLAQDFTDAEKAQGRSNIGAVSATEVSTAISNAVGQLDVSDNVTANQFVTSVSESDGRVSVTRRQPVIADVSGLQDELSRITPQVQSDWTETDENLPSYVKHKPENLVQDANYVHTDNNFTTTLKNKLDGIQSGAEVNVQSDWNTTDQDADSFIRNKPTIPTVNNGTLTIQKNGATVATFSANQSGDSTANISVPTKTSQLTNDSGFITASDVPQEVEYVDSSKTFADVQAIVNAGHLPVFVVNTIPSGPGGYYRDRYVMSSYHYSESQGKSASFSRTDGSIITTYTIDGTTNQWTTTTTNANYATYGANGTNIEAYFTANSQNINDINAALNNKQPLCNMYIDGTNPNSGSAYTETVNARDKGFAPMLNVGGIYLPLTYVSLDPNDSSVMWYHFEDSVSSTDTAYHRIVKPSSITNSDTTLSYTAGNGISIANNVVSVKPKAGGGLDVGADGVYVTAHHVSYDANQGLSTANQGNARNNINAFEAPDMTNAAPWQVVRLNENLKPTLGFAPSMYGGIYDANYGIIIGGDGNTWKKMPTIKLGASQVGTTVTDNVYQIFAMPRFWDLDHWMITEGYILAWSRVEYVKNNQKYFDYQYRSLDLSSSANKHDLTATYTGFANDGDSLHISLDLTVYALRSSSYSARTAMFHADIFWGFYMSSGVLRDIGYWYGYSVAPCGSFNGSTLVWPVEN